MRTIVSCFLASALAVAQMAQNPSPMVEHTRRHPRLTEQTPPGKRTPLEMGTLFIPEKIASRRRIPLLIFFHGGKWLPEIAAARRGMAVISIQLGAGSGTYAQAFTDPKRFSALLTEAEHKSGATFGAVTVAGWSAGCGAIRELIKSPDAYDRIAAAIAIDGIHSGYVNGKPGPKESHIETAPLGPWLHIARDAIAGRKRLLITHSEIFPGTFASTTETADYLLTQLGLTPRPVVKWGPMGTQQLSEVRSGRMIIRGYAGNSAPDHVDQLHSLPEYLQWLR